MSISEEKMTEIYNSVRTPYKCHLGTYIFWHYKVNNKAVRDYKTYNGIISENGLRLENGLNQRVSYWYH